MIDKEWWSLKGGAAALGLLMLTACDDQLELGENLLFPSDSGSVEEQEDSASERVQPESAGGGSGGGEGGVDARAGSDGSIGLDGSDGSSGATSSNPRCADIIGISGHTCCTDCIWDNRLCQENGCYSGWHCDSRLCECVPPPSPTVCCAGMDGPETPSSCSRCETSCQANGCYNGWYCRTGSDFIDCVPPPNSAACTAWPGTGEGGSERTRLWIGADDECPVCPTSDRELLPVSHEPSEWNSERVPRYPRSGDTVTLSVTAWDTVAEGALIWSWYNAKGVKSDGATVPLEFSYVNGEASGWKASFTMPPNSVGTYGYYFRLEPTDTTKYQTTYLHYFDCSNGSDYQTNLVTACEDKAAAGPYLPLDILTSPENGEVFISEVMYNTQSESAGDEWFEVTSIAPVPICLDGFRFTDIASKVRHEIYSFTFFLWPGSYAVLAATERPADLFDADYVYGGGYPLGDEGDQIRLLRPDGRLFDTVSWDLAYSQPGQSVQLKSGFLNSNQNGKVATEETGAPWCVSANPYPSSGSAHYGTPRSRPDCL